MSSNVAKALPIKWYEINLYIVSILTSLVTWVFDMAQINRRFNELGWNFFVMYGIIFTLVWTSIYLLSRLASSTGQRFKVWLSHYGVTGWWDYGAIVAAGGSLFTAYLFGTVSDYHIGGAILLTASAIQGLWLGRDNRKIQAGGSTQP